jgi:chemotaxis protein CheC
MDYRVDVRKLELFNRMSKQGAATVSNHLNQMTDLDTAIAVSKINFLDIEDVKTHVGSEDQVGIYVQLTDAPKGYVLFMLDPDGSKTLARSMLPEGMDPGEPADGEFFTDMERSAMQEIGNIMTSGFIDGWANVLDTTIDMSTPTFTLDEPADIIDDMGGWPDEDIALVIDSQVVSASADVDVTVYTFPQVESLVRVIQNIDVDTDVEADTTASDIL